MFQRLLKKHYGIESIESNPIGHYQSCQKENQRFLLVPVGQMDKEVIVRIGRNRQPLKEKWRSVGGYVSSYKGK